MDFEFDNLKTLIYYTKPELEITMKYINVIKILKIVNTHCEFYLLLQNLHTNSDETANVIDTTKDPELMT